MTSNDLFLLMVSLSQISSVKDIKRLFLEAMNYGCENISFSLSTAPDQNAAENIKVATEAVFFGYVIITGDFYDYSPTDQALIRNAIALLTIILENKHNAELLLDQNIRLEQSVRENEEMIGNITRTAPMIIYIYDLVKKKTSYVNPEITHITGYTPEQIESSSYMRDREFFYHKDLKKIADHHGKLRKMEPGSQKVIEYRVLDKDNTIHWLISRDTPYKKDSQGLTVSILGCAVDITGRKLAEQGLENSLKEKEILLKEVYHRTKNNMQVIMSLLTLQERHSKNDEVISVFTETRNRIYSMALVHNKLYQTGDLTTILLNDYLTDLLSRLLNSFSREKGGVVFSVRGDPVYLNIDTAIPCGLVMNEIITNTLKHGFKTKTEKSEKKIEIVLTKKIKNITILYKDNGCGLGKNVNTGKPRGLGMQLIKSIIEGQLKGKVVYKNDEGLRTVITIPGGNNVK